MTHLGWVTLISNYPLGIAKRRKSEAFPMEQRKTERIFRRYGKEDREQGKI